MFRGSRSVGGIKSAVVERDGKASRENTLAERERGAHEERERTQKKGWCQRAGRWPCSKAMLEGTVTRTWRSCTTSVLDRLEKHSPQGSPARTHTHTHTHTLSWPKVSLVERQEGSKDDEVDV